MAQISERRQQKRSDSADVLSLLLDAEYEDGQPMGDLELRDNLLSLLNAGHETTATSIAWAMYWLHKKPEVLENVLSELNTSDLSDAVAMSSQCPYLTAVCQETLRIHPVVLFTFPRITLRSVELSGYHVEAGTTIRPCIYLTHRRSDLYPDPDELLPERFLNGKFSSYEFWPFGAGSRQCLGQVFALFEMKLILATILLNGTWKLTEKADVPPSRRGFLMASQGGVKMNLVAGSAA